MADKANAFALPLAHQYYDINTTEGHDRIEQITTLPHSNYPVANKPHLGLLFLPSP